MGQYSSFDYKVDLRLSLEEYLTQNGVWHRFIQKKQTIHTADAARATGILLNMVTKNLVSITDNEEYVLLIVPGDKKVDLRKAAIALSAGNVKLVPFEAAERISGYPPGGTPSVGHKTRMRTVIDKSLLVYKTIYCGGGAQDRLLELQVQDITKLNESITADIIQ